MFNKLLIISGPTASGKTDLAVKLAKKYNGQLISADSRQIYQDLNIGVGKDHPPHTPIHLIDIISPKDIFSAGQFRLLALKAITDVQSRGKLPILVGGTGFYIDTVINPRSTFNVTPNKTLRFFLNLLNLKLLQLILRLLDFKTFDSLNPSDLSNPRRLIRKIEISLSVKSPFFKGRSPAVAGRGISSFDLLHLSLTAPNAILYQRIDARVENRLKIGHLDELNGLLRKYTWSDPGLQISCYKVFNSPLVKEGGGVGFESAIQRWKFAEHRDARHQKTWFKRYPDCIFIDVSKPINYPRIHKIVDRWYNMP